MPEPEALPPTPPAEAPPTGVPVAPGGSDPQVVAPPTGQLILGVDKRNPVFAVYGDESGERLLFYYGFELMEIVNDEPSDPGFKLLLARLDNAGVKLSAIGESFEVDPKTVRRWGQEIKDVLGVSLSRSGISDLVRELKSVPAPVAQPLPPEVRCRRWP